MGEEALYVFHHCRTLHVMLILRTVKVIPRQLFEVPIQAAVGKKIIARETLSAMRADVTAGLYGGMPTAIARR